MKTREEILSRHDYHIYSPEEGTLHVVDYWDALEAMEEYKNQAKQGEGNGLYSAQDIKNAVGYGMGVVCGRHNIEFSVDEIKNFAEKFLDHLPQFSTAQAGGKEDDIKLIDKILDDAWHEYDRDKDGSFAEYTATIRTNFIELLRSRMIGNAQGKLSEEQREEIWAAFRKSLDREQFIDRIERIVYPSNKIKGE